MTFLDQFLGDIRDGAPSWTYVALHVGWQVLTVLTLISMLDLAYRLFRRDHGLTP